MQLQMTCSNCNALVSNPNDSLCPECGGATSDQDINLIRHLSKRVIFWERLYDATNPNNDNWTDGLLVALIRIMAFGLWYIPVIALLVWMSHATINELQAVTGSTHLLPIVYALVVLFITGFSGVYVLGYFSDLAFSKMFKYQSMIDPLLASFYGMFDLTEKEKTDVLLSERKREYLLKVFSRD